ncbi:MAG: hypothetical protein AAF721_28500 [Myxococcota bacterium]
MLGRIFSIYAFAAPPEAGGVVDGGHHVTMSESGDVVVHTEWLSDGAPSTLPLSLPLPAGAAIEGIETVRNDGGLVVAAKPNGKNVVFAVRMAAADVDALGALPLAIPAVAGTHRVTVDKGLVFDADVALGLAPRLTRAATAGVTGRPSRWLDRKLSLPTTQPGITRYTTTADLQRVGGFVGRLQTVRARRRRLLLWAGAGFVLVVTALVAAYRRLRRGAELEQAEALLAQEIEALGS